MTWSALTEKQKGYIAGFIDADGSITISKQRQSGGVYYRPVLHIYNNSQRILENIASNLTEDVEYYVDKRRDSRHNQDTYVLQIRRQEELRKALKNIEPYLKLKQDQAQKVIQVIDLIQDRDSHAYTDDLRTKLQKHHKEIKVMND